MYIVKFFVPINLAMFYPYPIFTNGHVPLIIHLSPFILIAGVALIYFFLRKEKALMFGLLFYFFSIVLVIQFFPVGNAVMADRYSYLAYIGLLFVVAWLFNKVWTSQANRYATLKYPFAIVLFVAAILFSAQSWSRTQVWRNTSTLWADELSKYPYVAPTYEKFYHSFALYYQAVKQYDRALLDWNSALILNANDTTALSNRANILYQRGEYDPALVDYTHAIGLNPKDTLAYANRALVFVKKKDYADAEKDFAVAIKLDSARENNYFNRGLFYNETNQDEKALADFKKCLQLKAGNDSIYNWLGVSNHKLKRYDEAIANFTKAIAMKPQSAQYWLNRSFSENALNEKQEAGKDAIKAQQLGMAVDVNYLKFLGLQ
jgi:tetratricopeptide (TPR) repeat protein